MTQAPSAPPASGKRTVESGRAADGAPDQCPGQARLTTEVLHGPAAYRDLQGEWRRLLEAMPGATAFQAPELLAAWAESFTLAGDPRRPCTLVVRRGGDPALIWPLALYRRGPLRMASSAGAPIAQYDEVLLDPGCDADAALAAAWRALAESRAADVLALPRVRIGGPLHRLLAPRGAPIGPTDEAPFADLPGDGLESFLGGLKPRIRRRQRQRARQLEEIGPLAFATAEEPGQAQEWLEEALSLKREWLVATGRVSGAFLDPRTRGCLVALGRALCAPDSRPRMLVARLDVGGRMAAVAAGLVEGATYYLYLGAYHPGFGRFGPGNVLTERVIGWCMANGVRCYDMLAPVSRSKGEWQSGAVPLHEFAIPVSPRGRPYCALIERRLKPAARAAFYALPQGLRAMLAARALRI